MSRTSVMTIGILLIFLGIKLNLIESYQLSQSATRFWMERIEDPGVAMETAQTLMQSGQYGNSYANQYSQSRYQAASYPFSSNAYNNGMNQLDPNGGIVWPTKSITPPNWLCWPVFFLGAVMLLHGASLKHD